MWMDLEGVMLSEISQRKTNTVCSHLYAESKKSELREVESRMMVARGWEVGAIGRCCPKCTKSSYKMNKFWVFSVQHGDYD